MSITTSSSSIAACIAFAILVVLLSASCPAGAGRVLSASNVPAEEHCATASFKELCNSMVDGGNYKDELEMAAGVFVQAKQKIQDAIGDVDKHKNAGAQGKVVQECRKAFVEAESKMEKAIKSFAHPQTDWANWDNFIVFLGEAVKSADECTGFWEDSKMPGRFILEDVNTNLMHFLYVAYDLGTKVLAHETWLE